MEVENGARLSDLRDAGRLVFSEGRRLVQSGRRGWLDGVRVPVRGNGGDNWCCLRAEGGRAAESSSEEA
jgi:hypothetical protein